MQINRLLLILLLLGASLFAQNKNSKLPIDSVTSLVVAPGLEDVKENCTVCHTGRFIVVNGGDRKFWSYKVKLMQKAYGLWQLKPEAKERIINYLATHYSKKKNISLEEH